MGVTKSYKKDIQLLLKILDYQNKIKQVVIDFKCTENDIENNIYAFDLCALYMAQIGEASKYLTDSTKQSFMCFDPSITSYFRNMIDHMYEKVNKKYLKAYIFTMINQETVNEIKDRLNFCSNYTE